MSTSTSSLLLEVRATTGIVLRELRVQARYPISMLNLALLTPLYEMVVPSLLLGATFLVGGQALGLASLVGTTDLAGWLVLGTCTATVMVGIVLSVNGTIQADRTTGALEYSWASPVPRRVFVRGAVLAGSLFSAAAGGLVMLFAVLVLGARFDPVGLLESVPVVLVTGVGLTGGAYLVAAATIRVRRPGQVLEQVTGLVVIFSGVVFPLTILPTPVLAATFVLPSTWGLDLVRHLVLGTRTLAAVPTACVALVATSALWWAAGRVVFARAERAAQCNGILAQY